MDQSFKSNQMIKKNDINKRLLNNVVNTSGTSNVSQKTAMPTPIPGVNSLSKTLPTLVSSTPLKTSPVTGFNPIKASDISKKKYPNLETFPTVKKTFISRTDADKKKLLSSMVKPSIT